MSIKKTSKLSKLIFFSAIGFFIGAFSFLKGQDSKIEYATFDINKAFADAPQTGPYYWCNGAVSNDPEPAGLCSSSDSNSSSSDGGDTGDSACY